MSGSPDSDKEEKRVQKIFSLHAHFNDSRRTYDRVHIRADTSLMIKIGNQSVVIRAKNQASDMVNKYERRRENCGATTTFHEARRWASLFIVEGLR